MEFVDLREEIAWQVAAGEPERAGLIEAILELWPDAKGFRSPWGLRFCSMTANPEVNQIDLERGSVLRVYPFVAIGPHDRLYSYPPCYEVADACVGFGEIPRSGWDEAMVVSSCVITQVRDYLEKHQPVPYGGTNG